MTQNVRFYSIFDIFGTRICLPYTQSNTEEVVKTKSLQYRGQILKSQSLHHKSGIVKSQKTYWEKVKNQNP